MVGSCLALRGRCRRKARETSEVPMRRSSATRKRPSRRWGRRWGPPHSDPYVLAARVAAIDQDRAIAPHVEDRGQAARAPLAFGAGRPRLEMLIRPRCRALLFTAHLIPHWRTEFLSTKVNIRSYDARSASNGLRGPRRPMIARACRRLCPEPSSGFVLNDQAGLLLAGPPPRSSSRLSSVEMRAARRASSS